MLIGIYLGIVSYGVDIQTPFMAIGILLGAGVVFNFIFSFLKKTILDLKSQCQLQLLLS